MGNRPIIFLDMDGVISTHRAWKSQTKKRTPHRWIDSICVRHLNDLVARSGAAIVVSSTWRLDRSRGSFWRILSENGVQARLHMDWRTKSLAVPAGVGGLVQAPIRGDEVAEWLSRHPEAQRYVILDDEDDFRPGQPLVQTEFEVGLTAAHVEGALAILDSTNV